MPDHIKYQTCGIEVKNYTAIRYSVCHYEYGQIYQLTLR